MSRKPLAVAAVIVAAGAIVAAKMARQRPAETTVVARATAPSVVLVADPREADSDCGCGKIIRRVREAKARGVTVEEFGPGDPSATRYGVAVVPTVLVMSPDGGVLARREGESGETLAAIDADLAKLEGQKR